MSRTPANKTLISLAIALACVGGSGTAALASASGSGPVALASTGGASAPHGKHAAKSRSSHSRAAKTAAGEQIATWFGPGFYGQKTACGQTMTPRIVGVASRTLPCGTLVLVNYKGHQLTVPVIDRGPYAHNGATWDLTWGAASALSIEDTVRIKTKVVGHAPNSLLLGAPAEVKPTAASAAVSASGGTAAR
jgi:rare lipoprotein A (peptidoglycan hydrolase)